MRYITTIDGFVVPLKCIVAIRPSESGTHTVILTTGDIKHAIITDIHNTLARWIDIANGTS